MKKFIIVFLVLFYSLACAEDRNTICSPYGDFAASVMKGRHEGTSMQTMIDTVDGNEFLERIIIDAYERPRYSSKEMQRRSSEDFRNEIYLQCFKAGREK